mmetsp:Transcript_21788/g.49597  ORF Transcript_21788/g.49597 Transcript_21788/m.49597 type:complete len:320 (+) Transcript_21788:69-1028(+)
MNFGSPLSVLWTDVHVLAPSRPPAWSDGYSVDPQLKCFDPLAEEDTAASGDCTPGSSCSSSTASSDTAPTAAPCACVVETEELRCELKALEKRHTEELAAVKLQVRSTQRALDDARKIAIEQAKRVEASALSATQWENANCLRACWQVLKAKVSGRKQHGGHWDAAVASRELHERLEAMERRLDAELSRLHATRRRDSMEEAVEDPEGTSNGTANASQKRVLKACLGDDLRRISVSLRCDGGQGDLDEIQLRVSQSFQEQLLGFDAFDLYYVPLHDILMAVENQCLTAEAVPELITGGPPGRRPCGGIPKIIVVPRQNG